MPEMDGFELAKRIRQLESEWIPIIFLSGIIDDKNIEKGINAGGDDYLFKPSSEIAIAAKIKAMQRIYDMKNRLNFLSKTDPLTEINNRLQFDIYIKRAISDSKNHHLSFALLFIDLDNFKMINDHFGHPIGDSLLREVAKRLKFCLRSDDFVARMGGDEFAIILKDVESNEMLYMFVKKIQKVITTPYTIENKNFFIKTSIGISCYPADGINASQLLQNADIAMYHAKSMGKNNFQFHSKIQSSQFKQKVQLENELNFALDKKEFYIDYQPMYDLQTRQMVGIEALLRWNHPKHGILSPELFIPIAEESGIVLQISEWAFEEICKQASRWGLNKIPGFKLSFNVSPLQLLKPNTPQFLVNCIKANKLSTGLFEAELTETILISHASFSQNVIEELYKIGISFAVDDFGTGYSSLNHLKVFPIRLIKIDKSFIDGIHEDPKNAVIVEAIIQLGIRMNLDVMAEGIETEEQLNFLLKLHCPKGQGIFLSPSLSVEKMTMLIENTKAIS
jgi:diguanylate cyclase (GGDEF)-like protein